jgi:hypothetical protein
MIIHPEEKLVTGRDYAVTVYSNILKKLFPEVPLIIGGIEASLRRLYAFTITGVTAIIRRY